MPVCGFASITCVSSVDISILWRMEVQMKSNKIVGNLKC